MNFENKMRRLEEINAMLKSSDTGLEAALELFAEGSRLTDEIKRTIEDAKRKIEKVESHEGESASTVPLDEDGNVIEDEKEKKGDADYGYLF